jgi:hypothetical protein
MEHLRGIDPLKQRSMNKEGQKKITPKDATLLNSLLAKFGAGNVVLILGEKCIEPHILYRQKDSYYTIPVDLVEKAVTLAGVTMLVKEGYAFRRQGVTEEKVIAFPKVARVPVLGGYIIELDGRSVGLFECCLEKGDWMSLDAAIALEQHKREKELTKTTGKENPNKGENW